MTTIPDKHPHLGAATYSEGEELANVITHAVGVILSIAALVLMVRYAAIYGDIYRLVSVTVFGACLILSYLSSTLYHTFTDPLIKYKLRLFDHSCIYLLIAGSYTPFTLVLMRDGWGWSLFTIIWSFAVVGILFKLLSSSRFNNVTVAMYIAMGWMVVFAAKPMLAAMPEGCMSWLVLGGLMYTSGVIFYLWRRLPFNHAIWHLFVMAGSISHFVAVYWYVLPARTI